MSFKNEGRLLLLQLTLLITVFHRHLTFPLVYGDREVFDSRKKTFTLLPIFLFLLTVVSLLYVREPAFTTSPLPQPVQFKKGESLLVYLREPKRVKNARVVFSGKEKSVGEVAAAFRRAVGQQLNVQVVGDSLHFALPKDSSLKKFSFGVLRGKNLRKRLGLPKGILLGFKKEKPLFIALVILSALWNFYHTLMQKQGILRVYSRKADYGKPWLDRAMVWVWFGWLFFALASSSVVRRQVSRLATSGKFLTDTLKPIFHVTPHIATAFLITAAVLTAFYFWHELKNRHQFHWPKNLFLLSLWGIYLTFFYDFLVGFITFGFAHAVEYLAFVNVYAKKKYTPRSPTSSWMARWVSHQGRSFVVFMALSAAIFIPWYKKDPMTLNWFIVTTSFMHFLYDGWIWKVRKKEVGAPLGIKYQTA